ncbi:MAG: SDR family oxidoreductase [Caldilineaceae bacterium SB0661_bin_32]|uniref:SDR family oxidoreductase n=1 Tax=Caldilineaceae bacterium SB0661_bin_32 TaxID=2605255 RepID=A0A6B1DC43_9CHLR|nr:SDR family oxidoreductase [Caldilineaceae bacterium SB0661_bin_32]
MFSNQTVVITGAGRGIGASAALQFAECGANVVVNDLDSGMAEETVHAIQARGGQAVALAGDVTAAGFPEKLMQEAVDRFGRLNVLVNNAGYTWDGMAHKISDEQWQAILDVHLSAPFRMIRAAAPHLRQAAAAELASGSGRSNRCIVNVSSTSGLHGNIGQANYAAGKMGVVGLTKTIAKEWGPLGIRCNAVAFGFIDTRLTRSQEVQEESIEIDGREVVLGIPQKVRTLLDKDIRLRIPLGRPAAEEEAAAGIVLIASPLASYITGHVLEVTGGMGI